MRSGKPWASTMASSDSVLPKSGGFPSRCGRSADVVRCVEVANLLCSLKGVTSVGMKLRLGPLEGLRALALSKEDLVVMGADLDRELARQADLFNV